MAINKLKTAGIITLIIAASFAGSHLIYGVRAASPADQSTCPAGTYRIGGTEAEPVCKNEPSGCPFYENVGPKGCVPPPNIKCSDDTFTNCWSVETPAPSTDYPTDQPTTTPTKPVASCAEK